LADWETLGTRTEHEGDDHRSWEHGPRDRDARGRRQSRSRDRRQRPGEAKALADELGGTATATDKDSVGGEIVVLAVYYPAALAAAQEYGDQLAGKVVVDISNPVDSETMDGLAVPADSSAAEELAKRLPSGTPVVKAFNTVFATTLVGGEVAGRKLDVCIAGDGEAAKQTVATLVESAGLRPLDVGPLRRARQLEQLMFLNMTIQEPLLGYQSAIKVLP
jgi:8-hydroxy-5-deazaflavin:NADPH oxidoreductase